MGGGEAEEEGRKDDQDSAAMELDTPSYSKNFKTSDTSHSLEKKRGKKEEEKVVLAANNVFPQAPQYSASSSGKKANKSETTIRDVSEDKLTAVAR